MAHKPLKSTDKRRSGLSHNVRSKVSTDDGAGEPLADLFSDRRKHVNGSGKRAK